MPRTMLTDEQWQTLKEILFKEKFIYNKFDLRNTFEGILYRMRTGIQWRDLPPEFGRWNTIFKRFNVWSKKEILQKLFKLFSSDNDPEWLFIDGSIVKAHQDSTGAASDSDEAIGKSVCGNSTKIHLVVDSCGLPIHFELSGGQVHDIKHGASLVLASPESDVITTDKGYDCQDLRDLIESQGSIANIPRKSNSKAGNGHMDWCLYKYRHLVENAFMKIKKYRAVATRYDKLVRNYASTIALAFILMWLPMHC